MSWIRQVPLDQAAGELKQIYDAGRARAGSVAQIIQVMSLRPRSLGNMMKFYLDQMHGASPLSRAERELLAAVTSQVNGCFY
ncbi:MAG: carboxymuconolactone decarboxylase family protein [Planctomycetes bacterium]|nr:carboxymuconolactone decarboxylase family protein [Planctomycetota bacterium]